MAKPASRNARAKGVERQVQQYIWPGSRFEGNAHRPALARQDVCGPDAQGRLWWGEVKNWGLAKVASHGGIWQVLTEALTQSVRASLCERVQCRSFSVWWPPGHRLETQRLAMFDLPGQGRLVVTLWQFREMIRGGPIGLPPPPLNDTSRELRAFAALLADDVGEDFGGQRGQEDHE